MMTFQIYIKIFYKTEINRQNIRKRKATSFTYLHPAGHIFFFQVWWSLQPVPCLPCPRMLEWVTARKCEKWKIALELASPVKYI